MEEKTQSESAKILVVDDIQTNLIVAKGLLEPYRVQVDLCESGKAAIAAVRTKNYDLVLMDYRMPEMDGIEAVRRIRAFGVDNPHYENVPIVAFTAEMIRDVKKMLLQSGFDDYLAKPASTAELDTMIEKWIPMSKQLKTLA